MKQTAEAIKNLNQVYITTKADFALTDLADAGGSLSPEAQSSFFKKLMGTPTILQAADAIKAQQPLIIPYDGSVDVDVVDSWTSIEPISSKGPPCTFDQAGLEKAVQQAIVKSVPMFPKMPMPMPEPSPKINTIGKALHVLQENGLILKHVHQSMDCSPGHMIEAEIHMTVVADGEKGATALKQLSDWAYNGYMGKW